MCYNIPMYRKDNQNEFYTLKAKQDGYPARSVYKLEEIDRKFKLTKKGIRVLDLGAAPGSWSLYLLKQIGEKGMVAAIDKEDLKIPAAKNLVFIKQDIGVFVSSGLEKFNGFSLVVSDLSPSTTGVKELDSGRSFDLSKAAWLIAKRNLKKHGDFLVKVFSGGSVAGFIKAIKSNFTLVKIFRPKASPKGSKEVYLVAKNFLGE